MSFIKSFTDGFFAMADSLFPKCPSFAKMSIIWKRLCKDKQSLARDFNMFNSDLRKGMNKIIQKNKNHNLNKLLTK